MRFAQRCSALLLVLLSVNTWAQSPEQKLTVTGKLVRVMAIGGESTGWAIELNPRSLSRNRGSCERRVGLARASQTRSSCNLHRELQPAQETNSGSHGSFDPTGVFQGCETTLFPLPRDQRVSTRPSGDHSFFAGLLLNTRRTASEGPTGVLLQITLNPLPKHFADLTRRYQSL
jgi:hypothetical protein